MNRCLKTKIAAFDTSKVKEQVPKFLTNSFKMPPSASVPAVRFATSAISISVHDTRDETATSAHIYNYTPAASRSGENAVQSSSWASDGSCLASCVDNSDKIVMTYSKKNVFTSAETVTVSSPVAVLFPRTTVKKLVVATKEGKVV